MGRPEALRTLHHPDSIVLTGVGLCTSLGISAETTWQAMLRDETGMAVLTEVESILPVGSVGGQALELPSQYRPDLPREARSLRWTIEHALADAGLPDIHTSPVAPHRCFAMLGTTLHGLRAGGRYLRSGNADELSSFLAGATASLTLRGLGIEGGTATTCSACSSSLGAIALGVTLLETHQADLVVAGGYDAISEYAWAGFNALRLIAPTALRPFCCGRQGMKVGEGYGIVILERGSTARNRGGRVLAHLTGWGESADAHHLTKPHPQGHGALAAMHAALRRAGIPPRQLSLITAHATGTPDNDAAEAAALVALLGNDLPAVPVVAHKGRLGHTLGGAGAIELILSALSLRDQKLLGTANVNPEDVEFPTLAVSTGTASSRLISHTLNTSLGFGGANTCVVLSRSEADCGARYADSHTRKACITGIGIVLPGAIGLSAFTARIRSESREPAPPLTDAILSEIMTARRTRRMSPSVRYMLAAAEMAIAGASLLRDSARLPTASCLLGSMHGSIGFCSDYYTQIVNEGVFAANPVLFAEGVPNAAAAHLSTAFGIRGGCQTIIGARTAGLDALALAALRIKSGASDLVLVAAAEEQGKIVDDTYSHFKLRAVDSNSAGFTSSHGSVAFVVEAEETAIARGARPLAILGKSASALLGPGSLHRAVARVLSKLGNEGEQLRIIGSANRTRLDRAEAHGIARACCVHSPHHASLTETFGEVFSVTPLIGIAASLTSPVNNTSFTSLCSDWDGSVTAMNIEQIFPWADIGDPATSA